MTYWHHNYTARIAYNLGRFARQKNIPWDRNPYSEPRDKLTDVNAWQQGWHDEEELLTESVA